MIRNVRLRRTGTQAETHLYAAYGVPMAASRTVSKDPAGVQMRARIHMGHKLGFGLITFHGLL